MVRQPREQGHESGECDEVGGHIETELCQRRGAEAGCDRRDRCSDRLGAQDASPGHDDRTHHRPDDPGRSSLERAATEDRS